MIFALKEQNNSALGIAQSRCSKKLSALCPGLEYIWSSANYIIFKEAGLPGILVTQAGAWVTVCKYLLVAMLCVVMLITLAMG